MKLLKLVKDNAVLVTGITLPLLVVVFFLVATYVPGSFVAPPRHDLVFTSYDHSYLNAPPIRVHIRVSDGRLIGNLYKNGTSIPRLFVFEHATQNVREIAIELPKDLEDFNEGQAISIPDAADMRISTNLRAPDGYEFRANRYRRGLVGDLFFGGTRSRQHVIAKNGATVTIPPTGYQDYYGVNFVGWVVGQ